jgi:hypothetical protein
VATGLLRDHVGELRMADGHLPVRAVAPDRARLGSWAAPRGGKKG